MPNHNAQTWSWSPEQEPPQAFADALAECPWCISVDFGGVLVQGYAQGVTLSGNCVMLKRPIIDYSEREGGYTLKSRYTRHESYFTVNCPVLYWPRSRKEAP